MSPHVSVNLCVNAVDALEMEKVTLCPMSGEVFDTEKLDARAMVVSALEPEALTVPLLT